MALGGIKPDADHIGTQSKRKFDQSFMSLYQGNKVQLKEIKDPIETREKIANRKNI